MTAPLLLTRKAAAESLGVSELDVYPGDVITITRKVTR